jgi:hypothetical protein
MNILFGWTNPHLTLSASRWLSLLSVKCQDNETFILSNRNLGKPCYLEHLEDIDLPNSTWTPP